MRYIIQVHNSEESERVQSILFTHGHRWATSPTYSPQHTDQPFLYFSFPLESDDTLGYSNRSSADGYVCNCVNNRGYLLLKADEVEALLRLLPNED